MILKLSIVVTFFLLATTVADHPKKSEAGFKIADIWNSFGQEHCACAPPYLKKVQQYYDDIVEAFSKHPDKLKEEAQHVKSTFQDYLTRLIIVSNSNSTVLSSGATKILISLSHVDLRHYPTAYGVLNEYLRVLSVLIDGYTEIVSDLRKIIGKNNADRIIEALRDVEAQHKAYAAQFLQVNGDGLIKQEEFRGVDRTSTALKAAIDMVADKNNKFDDASTVLELILEHLTICYHGLGSCCRAVLIDQKWEQFVRKVMNGIKEHDLRIVTEM